MVLSTFKTHTLPTFLIILRSWNNERGIFVKPSSYMHLKKQKQKKIHALEGLYLLSCSPAMEYNGPWSMFSDCSGWRNQTGYLLFVFSLRFLTHWFTHGLKGYSPGIEWLLLFFSALRIHMSNFTADLLIAAGGYHLDCRGEIPVKVCGLPLLHKNMSLSQSS